MTSSSVCLYHSRQYASNIQRILNLLRVDLIQRKYDLNMIAKKSLCICSFTDQQMIVSDRQWNKIEKDFDTMKSKLMKLHQWPEEIDYLVQTKIFETCDTKISTYKLLKLVCEATDETKLSKLMRTITRVRKDNVHGKEEDDLSATNIERIPIQAKSKRDRQLANKFKHRIELTIPPNQIGHLLGRNGRIHKSLMTQTDTRIHFTNMPYSIPSGKKRPSEFNLDSLQSSSRVTAVITGPSQEAVVNAREALENLDRMTQINISPLQ